MLQNLLSAVPVLGHHNGLFKMEIVSYFPKCETNVWCIKFNDRVCVFISICYLNWNSDGKYSVQNLSVWWVPFFLPASGTWGKFHIPPLLTAEFCKDHSLRFPLPGTFLSVIQIFHMSPETRAGVESRGAVQNHPEQTTLVSSSTPLSRCLAQSESSSGSVLYAFRIFGGKKNCKMKRRNIDSPFSA